MNRMVAKQDIRAGLQLLKNQLQDVDSGNDLKLFLSDGLTFTVLKSIEVSNSGAPKNDGLVVSLIKFNVSRVDYYTVQYFRKDQSNRFFLAERLPTFGEQKSDSDKSLDAAIEEFEKTGKLN